MNHSHPLMALALAAALLPLAAWSQQGATPVAAVVTQPVAAPATQSATKAAEAPKKKKTRKGKKSGKRYSKATLSAFKPLPEHKALPTPAAPAAAAIVLSPVVNKRVAGALQAEPAPLLPQDSASSPVEIPAVTDVADEESRLVQHDRDTAPAGESSELGQESVSVIDRFADKPKAKPISNGPLKVRMKDSGVRASVQIPLEPGK